MSPTILIHSPRDGEAERYADLIRKVTRDDVQRVAKQYLQPERLITVIVGNLKKIGEK